MKLPRPVSIFEWAVVALIIFAAVLGGKWIWNVFHDSGVSNEGAVMAERLRGDSLERAVLTNDLAETKRQLGVALANGTRIVTRWRESAPQPIPTGTPHDSITHLSQQVKSCREQGDSLAVSVVQIQSKCEAYRDTATKAIANWERSYAHLDSLWKIGKPPRRFGIGPYIGYGINTDSAYAMRRGFSAGISIHYSIFSW